MSKYPNSIDYEGLLKCSRGELFGPGNAQLPSATDADVRPRHRNQCRRGRIWCRARDCRTGHHARSVVLRMPLPGRSDHARMPWTRCALAIDRLQSRMARNARTGSRARSRRSQVQGHGHAGRSDCDLPGRFPRGSSTAGSSSASRMDAFSRTARRFSSPATCGSVCSRRNNRSTSPCLNRKVRKP